MGKYAVFGTEDFVELRSNLDYWERKLIEKVQEQLAQNPTGKILKYYWFREKKFGDKRLYFIVDDNLKKVLIIAYGSKKEQQKTIRQILLNMDDFLEELKII